VPVEIYNELMRDLVRDDAEAELLASGHDFIEGPVWIADDACLLYSDIVGNTRWRWSERSGSRLIAGSTSNANGMTLDADSRLIVCEHATSSVVRMGADGTGAGRAVIASHHEGHALNSPNDVVVNSDGSIWFTDPAGWRLAQSDREQELDFEAVFRVAPDGGLVAVETDFYRPNGLCFSPDKTILYVNETPRSHIRAFDVAAGGSLSKGRIFAQHIGECDRAVGVVDGMKCDKRGNVWVTGPYGIWAFAPDGTHLGIIRVPEVTTNLHWGDADWKTLYITASSSLYRVRMDIAGAQEPFMR
jgi:gluconolactonase